MDYLIGGTHNWLALHHFRFFPESLEQFFGWIFVASGLDDRHSVERRSGYRQSAGHANEINEVVAFAKLGQMKESLDPRSFTIATFALCGFANFSSIGIQIGGIGALAPEQRGQLARFGIRAMLAGTMANLMSACIVGILS